MKEILIDVKNKIAMNLKNDTYVCDNSDYRVVFEFDEEWYDHPVKTARFKYNGMYQEVVFSGNICSMPVIRDARLISIGVYAGNLQTSTPAVVHASQSILSGDSVHAEPAEDVYNQLVELVESGVLQGPPGRDGNDGQDGAPGRDGADGKDGAPGRDGADGHTPVYGVDYGTPEQIAGIAKQAADIFQPDVNQIKDDLADKRNNIRFIASVEITELVSVLYINKDTNGDAFDLSEVVIIGVAPASTNADAANGYISIGADGITSHSGMFGAINFKSKAGETCWICNIIANPDAPAYAEISSAVRPVTAALVNKQVSFGNAVRIFRNITKIAVYPNGKIEPGTKIYVFGVDRI